MSMSFRSELHTKTGTPGTIQEYCAECSSAAKNWVSWPCSREKLVAAAVEMALHLESMDAGDRRLTAYLEGIEEGKKRQKQRFGL